MKKPLAPGEKQSGLDQMQDDSSSFDMATHEAFMLDELLPLVVGYAQGNNHPTEAAALATMAAMTTVLTAKGFTLKQLSGFLATLTAHDAPEGLQ